MDRIIITRTGKPVAVLTGVEEYESWVETLEVVSRKPLHGSRQKKTAERS